MKRFAQLLVPPLVLAIGIAAFLYLRATRPETLPTPPDERAWVVRAVPIHYQNIRPSITAFGEVVAGRSAELRALVEGTIVEVAPAVLDGAEIKAGDLLVRIDPFDYDAALREAQARLMEAEARQTETAAEIRAEKRMLGRAREQLNLRQRDFERASTLKSQGTASEKAADDAAIAVNAAEQAVISTQQTIERLSSRAVQLQATFDQIKVAVQRAQRDLQDTTLKAPFDGYLTDVNAALGKRVGSEPLARLIDANSLEAVFQLSNRDFARLLTDHSMASNPAPGPRGEGSTNRSGGLIGRPVQVRWRVGESVFVYPAVIERVGAEIDPASGGVHVYARIQEMEPPIVGPSSNNSGEYAADSSDEGVGGNEPSARTPPLGEVPLRPGAFVEVTVPGRLHSQAAALPDSAVSRDGHVYIIESGRLRAIPVVVLDRDGEYLVVQSKSGQSKSGESESPVTAEASALVLPEGALVVRNTFPEVGPGLLVRVRP